MITLLIISCLAALCVVEAKLESIIIKLKNPTEQNYHVLNKQEHFWSAVYYIVLCSFLGLMQGFLFGLNFKTLVLFFCSLVVRRLFFDFPLKKFRNRKIALIEGDMPLDNFVRSVLGKKGGVIELLILLVVLASGVIYLL